ncbi:trehalose-phosphatase [Mycolicibacterium elephantis]|uniref:trehalose-phosphatase n=1 Tax=Mycolicibacterium elephantis TaxID=81858 RepID=UPI0007EAA75D|nr:trehalose-phosphatase [Mycolicibacterium elephantis]OBB23320.1 trehalose-phosphatase [Mycolicibacterium elephantis]
MNMPVTIDPRRHDAVIFDLDSVVTDAASTHAAAWKTVLDEFLARRPASDYEDHSPFTDDEYRRLIDGKPRLEGVTDFLASRGISLPEGSRSDADGDTVWGLVHRKERTLPGQLDAGVRVFDSTIRLVRQLSAAGVKTAICSSSRNCEEVLASAGLSDLFTVRVDGLLADELGLAGKPDPAMLLEAARRVGADAERTVVIDHAEAGVRAARAGGFALVVAVDREGHADGLLGLEADAVVADLAEVELREGDTRMSRLPNALHSYGQLIGVLSGRRPIVCLDFDGTLSEIVTDPGTATLVDGAAEALVKLAAHCPVAIVTDRDLDDIRERVDIPGVWYAGSLGFELAGPDGNRYQNDAAAAAMPVLAKVAAELRAEFDGNPGVRVEHKRFSVAVHHHDVAPEQVTGVVAATRRCARQHGLRVAHGLKIAELRPNIDWNKGAAIAWICERINQPGRVVPIYLGDDPTDEDAFDALRFDGIGIVVRHDGDGDRPSAAQFRLDGAAEVRRFLRHGGNWLAYAQRSFDEAWTYTFDGYEPHAEKLREALCTVGNGYFATRGAAPESKAGQVHYPATYAAGVYNRLEDLVGGTRIDNESLVNLPNWLPLTFRIDDGDWFDIDSVDLLSYRQTLNLREAVLTREVRFRDDAGRTTRLTQHRFVAMHAAHVAALQSVIVAEDWSGTIQLRSTIDGNVRNAGVERYRGLASTHLTAPSKRGLSEDSVLMRVETTQSHVAVGLAARTTVWHGEKPAPATYRLVDEGLEIGHEIFTDLKPGQELTVEKIVSLVTGRDTATAEPATGAERRLERQERFATIRDAHVLAWAHVWERLSIEFEDHFHELRILRLHLLHLLQTVSPHSEDLDVGVPARGLHGEAYRGHVFWDELFIFPVLNLRYPTITRALLHYRYRRLQEARRAARLAGYSGAMFPWQSGGDGREESQAMHLNPRSGRWNPDASHRAHHIGIAIAYNVWQYYQVTGDLAYLIDYGGELLVEIARFWVGRTTYDEKRDRFGIFGVIGPDEFHSGYPDRPYDGIDNNAYTNVMAAWVIMRAIEALEHLPLPNRLDLREKLALTTEELKHWEHVSRRMFVPFHDGIISQFEGYEQLTELDWSLYRKRYGDIRRLDRILEAENDDVNRYKASKQADALMLLYLLSSDELRELLTRLGYRLAPAQIPKMVDYYLSRTSHGSTLSALVHTWVLARANRDHAMEFFEQVLKSDVADIQGGTTSEGIHLAAMAGSVDLVQRCFTGLETRNDRLVLAPNWPESLGALGFPLHYRDHHLYVRVSGKGAEVSVGPRDVPPVMIECHGRVEHLAPGSTIRFPSRS